MKFNSFYVNRPVSIGFVPDTETKFVDQSEADRCSIQYNLERFGMDGIASLFEKTKAQFGYADTRVSKNFAELAQTMADANSYFMQLPAEIRKKFGHSAVEFFSQIEKEPERMWKEGYISQDYAAKMGVESALVNLDVVTSDTPSQPVDTQPVVEDHVTE